MTNALFALHLMGPDDVYAAPSYEAALRVANTINVEFSGHAIKPYAVVVPWAKEPEEHVQSLGAWDRDFGSEAKVVPLSERRQLNKALDALDALSEEWAKEVNLESICTKLTQARDLPAAIYAMVVLGWVEGAYAGRTSHQDFPVSPQPFRNMQDGATFEQYRDALAVGGLTPVDQMAFDNMLHDRFFAPPEVDAGAERVMAAVAESVGAMFDQRGHDAIKACQTIPCTYVHKPDADGD